MVRRTNPNNLSRGMLTQAGIRNAPVPFFVRPITRAIAAKVESSFLAGEFSSNFAFVESQLTPSKFVCGTSSPTAADIMLEFPLNAAKTKGIVDMKTYPRICEYVALCESRGAYKRAVKRIVDEVGSYDII